MFNVLMLQGSAFRTHPKEVEPADSADIFH
jgi:hypothetical protein